MPLDRLTDLLVTHVGGLEEQGTAKGGETVIVEVLRPEGRRGPRFRLAGEGDRLFIRMNSNSYLGMALRPEVIAAEETATARFGAGPGAVRFISGTCEPHTLLEQRLAAFHGREAGMIFSSAYATFMSVIMPLTTDSTVLISDALNHNCIINAMRLARPLDKIIYDHLDMQGLERALEQASGRARRALIVTDGIFSMRGDHAPVDRIMDIARRWDAAYPENVVVIVDDSHGVGAFGRTGRGAEEHTGSAPCDILVATLGKALGVNGGYVVSSNAVIRFLRESAPMYIYSNPITAGEAAAALRALALLDSAAGVALLDRLRALTRHLEQGLVAAGFEIIPGEHPVVPLMVRDTARTRALVQHLRANGILATGLAFPVVPRGDEEIRFQINADHTEDDIDTVLDVLRAF
ncbi:MAG: pyridoxal phosphate-dependent aminotransferase family protein [Gemmatimonadetes bacterium]|nr:pyridoxal phosphate-dependent aminotransferase family protein [Gemmatimonadota bacterium]